MKNAYLQRIPARSQSHGRAKSCSLFVATAPLILALLDEDDRLLERGATRDGT